MENRSQDQDVQEQPSRAAEKQSATFRAREAAAKVGIGKSQSLFTLVLVSIAASFFIASYVLALGLFIMHKKHTDTVSDAAMEAARELSDITVSHPSTGPLNLCLWRDKGEVFFDSGNEKTRSFESVKRTYVKIEQLATITKIPIFKDLVTKDEVILNHIEKEMRFRLERAILPPMPPATGTGGGAAVSANGSGNGDGISVRNSNYDSSASPGSTAYGDTSGQSPGKIYRAIASLIASRYGISNSASLDLSIKLGFASMPPVQSKSQIFLVGAENFRPATPGTAPNMVLLSYTEPANRESAVTSITKPLIACAYIKPAPVAPPPAAMVITFPQGAPSIAWRLIDYLRYNWQAKGLWHQAMGGDMPGLGRLAPPLEPLLPEMSPGDALAAEIYHWLKYAGEQIDPTVVAEMLNESWTSASAQTDSSHSDMHSFGMMDEQINSCLVKDTGSREHALMYESKEGEIGQSAVARAFLINDSYRSQLSKPYLPENALPLFIDPLGRCNVAGQRVFDEPLIRDFFNDLYATNLAARETIATIKPMQQTSVQIISQLEQKLSIERDELASLVLRSNRLRSAAGSEQIDKKLSMQRRITNDRIEDLKLIVESDTTQLRQTKDLQRLATIARYNASRAELNTFDLNAQKLRYCRDGICRVPGQGYILGKNAAFKPLTKALLEADFYQLPGAGPTGASSGNGSGGMNPASSNNKNGGRLSPWLSNNLIVTGSPGDVFPDLDKSLTSRWLSQLALDSNSVRFTPLMLVVDSRSVLEGRKNKPGRKLIQSYTRYPFNNITLPESELLYYCQTAATTGNKPKVGWSVLARDFLANRGPLTTNGTSPTIVGVPVSAESSSWCQGEAFGRSCPGLACEFQVRTPLPLVENAFDDAFLQSAENGQRGPLIPVVTPDML